MQDEGGHVDPLDLGDQLASLNQLQTDAASASQSQAAGTATDPTAADMAVERARPAWEKARRSKDPIQALRRELRIGALEARILRDLSSRSNEG